MATPGSVSRLSRGRPAEAGGPSLPSRRLLLPRPPPCRLGGPFIHSPRVYCYKRPLALCHLLNNVDINLIVQFLNTEILLSLIDLYFTRDTTPNAMHLVLLVYIFPAVSNINTTITPDKLDISTKQTVWRYPSHKVI